MNLETGHRFVSRDVHFYEEIFPYNQQSITSSLINLFPANHTFVDDLVCLKPTTSSTNIPSSSTSSPNHTHSPEFHTNTHASSSLTTPPAPICTRPVRHRVLPAKFSDYVGLPKSHVNASIQYPITSVDTLKHLHPSYQKFVANSTAIFEPTSYQQAITDTNRCKAIQDELTDLEANNTWVITDLPPNKKKLGCKWLFKVKYKAYESLDKYKARLVEKG